MTRTTSTTPSKADEALDTLRAIARRLRSQVREDERLRAALPILQQADRAIDAGRHSEAASFIIEVEAAIDAHLARPPPRSWNILRVAPHMERRVRDALAEAGLQVYVPLETRWPRGYVRMSKAEKLRARPITRPLIPSYIFALLPNDKAMDLARANHAVRELMCFEGKPVRVPVRQLGALVLFEAAHEFDETWTAPSGRRGKRRRGANTRWKSGQRVNVKEGPFAGFFAQVLHASREDRVAVAVTIFGRTTPVDLHEDSVEVWKDGGDES